MAWTDPFAYVDSILRRGAIQQQQRPRGSTYRPTGTWKPTSRSRSLWSLASSGSIQTRRQQAPKPTSSPAGPPERFQLDFPWSQPATVTPQPPEPRKDTKGDLFGSLGEATGSLIGNLNIANVIPWLMERTNVLAHEYANAGGPGGEIATGATDAFIGAVNQVSQAVAPIIDAFPNWVRDSQLGDRAKLYRAVVNGEVPDYGITGPASNPLASLGAVLNAPLQPIGRGLAEVFGQGNPIGDFGAFFRDGGIGAALFGSTVSGDVNEYVAYRDILARTMDPEGRRTAQERLAAFADSIDIPESVKLAIRKNPRLSDEQISKLMDEAPEGRAWSYNSDISGMAQNLATPLVFYIAEMKAGMGAYGGVKAFGTAAGATRAVATVERITTPLAQLQKAAIISGVTYVPAAITLDTIARYEGNAAAIDWWERVNKSTEFSDDWNVQLVTGFAVNPFEYAGHLRNGIVKMKYGADLVVDKALGNRMAVFHDSDEAVWGMVARMFKQKDAGAAEAFWHSAGLNRQQAFDTVMENALDEVLQRLPKAERLKLNASIAHLDIRAKQELLLKRYGPRALDLIEKTPDVVAQRFYTRSWTYHQYDGPFSPELAIVNHRDFRAAQSRTEALRQGLGAVVGYAEHIPPEGLAWMRSLAREWSAADGSLQIGGLRSLDDLNRMFPAIRTMKQGLVTSEMKAAGRVPKEVVEEIFRRAEADWGTTVKQNPVRATTGIDPVLRPDSATPVRDYAHALGTDEATVQAIQDFNPAKPNAAEVDLMRRFIADKLGDDPGLATLSPDDVWVRASDYVDQVTKPWIEAGRRAQAVETRLNAINKRIYEIEKDTGHLSPSRTPRALKGEYEALTLEQRQLLELSRVAGDGVPYAEYATSQTRTTRAQATARKVLDQIERRAEARERLSEITAIDEGANAWLSGVISNGRHWTDYIARTPEGHWGWTGGLEPMPVAMRTRIGQALRGRGQASLAQNMVEWGDERLWAWVSKNPGIRESLTKSQQKVLDRVVGGKVVKESLDEAAQMSGGVFRDGDELLEALGRSAEQRQALLDGTSLYNLERTAAIKIPTEHSAAVEYAMKQLVRDPMFEAYGHPQNIAQVQRVLDGGAEMHPALRAAVERDPILLRRLTDEASKRAGYGKDYQAELDALLDDPANAGVVRDALVPPDFEPPVPGRVIEETPFDAIITAGDQAELRKMQAEIEGARTAPNPPVADVPASVAADIIEAQAVAANPAIARMTGAAERTFTPFAERVYAPMTEEAALALRNSPDPKVVQAADELARYLDDGTVPDNLKPQPPSTLAEADALADIGFDAAKELDPGTIRATLIRRVELATQARGGTVTSFTRPIRNTFQELWNRKSHPAGKGGVKAVRGTIHQSSVEKLVREVDEAQAVLDQYADAIDPRSLDEATETLAAARAFIDDYYAHDATRPAGKTLAEWAREQRQAAPEVRATVDESGAIRPGQEAASQAANVEAGVARGGTPESGGAVREAPKPPKRPSRVMRERLSSYHYGDNGRIEYDQYLDTAPSDAILNDPANRIGVEVLSILNHGRFGTRPASLRSVLALMETIENGNGDRLGIGNSLQAEAQRVAKAIMDDAVKAKKRTYIEAGVLTKGLDPAALPADDLELAAAILGGKRPLVDFDPNGGLDTLQYGLKKPPTDAVVLELSQVPGMAEELLTARFQPWKERVATAHARRVWNWIFGPLSNKEIGARVHASYLERANRAGVDPEFAQAIWEEWATKARESRSPIKRWVRNSFHEKGRYTFEYGDNPMYATMRNIPTVEMHNIAYRMVREAKNIDPGYRAQLEAVDFGALFREASSTIRGTLADTGTPLGKLLAEAYGGVAHNKAVTTLYYWFRFGLDVRYHAMNFMEGSFLYHGKYGLREGGYERGMLGADENFLRTLATDSMGDTGYPFSRTRMGWAYKSFLKIQREGLQKRLKGIQAEDPALMDDVLREIAAADQELAQTIKLMGHDPDGYIKALDDWHGRVLESVDPAMTIDDAIRAEVEATPAMGELYGKLAEVNRQLWDDVRDTMWGNPNRSRAERFLNSYLLFWPLSYQIKSTKWLMRLMFDRAGGLKTNAAGAVAINDVAETHQRLLENDPEYRSYFERHRNLAFVAEMLVPITPDGIGVSLNPGLRSLFFGRNRAFWDIGPIYTLTDLGPNVLRELYGDLYPMVKDLPFLADAVPGAYRGLSGRQAPTAPIDDEIGRPPQLPGGIPG